MTTAIPCCWSLGPRQELWQTSAVLVFSTTPGTDRLGWTVMRLCRLAPRWLRDWWAGLDLGRPMVEPQYSSRRWVEGRRLGRGSDRSAIVPQLPEMHSRSRGLVRPALRGWRGKGERRRSRMGGSGVGWRQDGNANVTRAGTRQRLATGRRPGRHRDAATWVCCRCPFCFC
jgi:hypothetical protein